MFRSTEHCSVRAEHCSVASEQVGWLLNNALWPQIMFCGHRTRSEARNNLLPLFWDQSSVLPGRRCPLIPQPLPRAAAAWTPHWEACSSRDSLHLGRLPPPNPQQSRAAAKPSWRSPKVSPSLPLSSLPALSPQPCPPRHPSSLYPPPSRSVSKLWLLGSSSPRLRLSRSVSIEVIVFEDSQ